MYFEFLGYIFGDADQMWNHLAIWMQRLQVPYGLSLCYAGRWNCLHLVRVWNEKAMGDIKSIS